MPRRSPNALDPIEYEANFIAARFHPFPQVLYYAMHISTGITFMLLLYPDERDRIQRGYASHRNIRT